VSTFASRFPARTLGALLVASAVGLAACSGGSGGSPTPTEAAAATPAATAAPTPSPTAASQAPSAQPSSLPTAVPTSIDPCQVVTGAEASALAGTTLGAGKEETTSGNGRICTYGGQTANVFVVIVAIAPDVATAKKEEVDAQARLRASASKAGQKLTVTQLPGFAPGADALLLELEPNPAAITGRAIYVLRGTTFFGFSDLVIGGSAPSADALKAQAMTSLGRLP